MRPQMNALDFGELLQAASAAACPLLFIAVVSYLLGLFVFGPLHARAAWTRPNTRFRIADILVLIVQVQIFGGLIFVLMPLLDIDDRAVQVSAAAGVWVLAGFWWWTGVRMLAKARVEHAPHRMWFLAVVLPLGYAATLGVLLAPATLAAAVAMAYWMVINSDPAEAVFLVLLLLANATLAGSLFGVRRFCQIIVEAARDGAARQEGIDFGPLMIRATPRAADVGRRLVNRGQNGGNEK